MEPIIIDTPQGPVEFPGDTSAEVIEAQLQQINDFQQPASEQKREIYDYHDPESGSIANSLLRGATFDLADEAMGGIATIYAKMYDKVTGKDSGITYSDAVKSVRGDQEAFAKRNPGTDLTAQIAGGLLTGGTGGAKVLGSQTLKQAPKFIKAAAVPLIAGAEGAAYGFGQGEGLEDSAQNALEQGTIAAVTGPLLNKIGGKISNKYFKKEAKQIKETLTPTQTIDSLKDEAQSFYKAAENSGIKIKDSSYIPFRDKLLKFLDAEAIDGKVYPQINKALKRISDLKDPSYKQLESIKKLLKHAKTSADHDVRRVAGIIDNEVDNFAEALSHTDLNAGDVTDLASNLKKAKGLWSRKAQAETMDTIEDKAYRAEAFIKQDDLDAAMRSKVRPLLDNPRRKLGLDKEVATSLQAMVEGTGSKKMVRTLSEMTPGSHTARGIFPAIGAAAVGMAVTGSPAGLLLGVVPALTGTTARKIANKMTKKEIEAIRHAIINKGQLEAEDIIAAIMEPYAPMIAGAASSLAASTSDEVKTQLEDLMQ